VLSLGVDDESGDGSLARLALRMELAARAQGFAPEARPFSGHVTIARARNATRVSRPDVSGIGDCGAFIADRVVLYRSELGPGGSRYFEEGVFPLPPGRVD
jgi:2'-5' RNA ligase